MVIVVEVSSFSWGRESEIMKSEYKENMKARD